MGPPPVHDSAARLTVVPALLRLVRVLRHLPVLCLLPALLACAAQEQIVSSDRGAQRQVALLTGTAPPVQPPAPEFGRFGLLEAEQALRRVKVRVAKIVSFNVSDEVQQLLDPDQVQWARAALARHIPTLKPDQRLVLRFRDRFHGLRVEAEIYPDGPALMYRFTQLASPDRSLDSPRDQANQRLLAYVELAAEPGQETDFDLDARYLRDRLFEADSQGIPLRDKLALVRAAMDAGHILAEDAQRSEAALEARPDTPMPVIARFLEKLQTLTRAREQGLFTAEEFAARRARLLDELR